MSTVLANPAEMIAHDVPRAIHNDTESEPLEFAQASFVHATLNELTGSLHL